MAARQQVEALKRQAAAPVAQEVTARQKAAQTRAVRERVARVEQASLEAILPELEALKARQGQKKGPVQPARVSTTDPEARVMKMPDGGFRPAFNVQLAQDTESRAYRRGGGEQSGSDQGADLPMRQQIAARQQRRRTTGTPVQEHLVDGGYAKHEAVENAAAEGVTLYTPVMQKKRKDGQNIDPYAPRPGDSPESRGLAATHRPARQAKEFTSCLRGHQRDLQRGPEMPPRPAAVPRTRPAQGSGGHALVGPGLQPAALWAGGAGGPAERIEESGILIPRTQRKEAEQAINVARSR